MPENRIIFISAPVKPLTKEQMIAAVTGAGESHPLWRTINQMLDAHMLEATLDVSESAITAEQRAHAAGRIAMATDVKMRLHALLNTEESPEYTGRRARKAREVQGKGD